MFAIAVLVLLATAVDAMAQAKPARAARTPAMSDEVLAGVQEAAGKAYPSYFVGVNEFHEDSQRLSIDTSRTELAFKIANATVQGGRYRLAASDRSDLLRIQCGDADLGEQFHCVSVRLIDADGKTVRPLSNYPARKTYQNALGAKWEAYEVAATYPIAGLERGFTVEYESLTNVVFTKQVNAQQAAVDLMLKLPWTP